MKAEKEEARVVVVKVAVRVAVETAAVPEVVTVGGGKEEAVEVRVALAVEKVVAVVDNTEK